MLIAVPTTYPHWSHYCTRFALSTTFRHATHHNIDLLSFRPRPPLNDLTRFLFLLFLTTNRHHACNISIIVISHTCKLRGRK